MSKERRCSDCKEFHSGQFSVCARCANERYVPRGKWCAKHGPTFGACSACKPARVSRPRFALVPSNVSSGAALQLAKATHRITSQPQAEFVAYLVEGAV